MNWGAMDANNGDDSIEFIRTDELSGEVRRLLFEWDADPFQSRLWGLTWRAKDHHILIYQRDQLVSHVGLVRETVRVGSRRVPVGGLGDVITVPEVQGFGFAGKALRRP